VLQLRPADRDAIVRHALDGRPNEVGGLFAGEPGDVVIVQRVYPCRNAAESPVVYELDSRDLGKANWDALQRGMEIVGVYHSHTHTEAYPSPTDVAKAGDPQWHYVLVSLQDAEPTMRSFRIVDRGITEEQLVVKDE
jgi:[CysO sulfur-carrier protein]-S-L-cysteine hydrolase